jgi:hypothetical protein
MPRAIHERFGQTRSDTNVLKGLRPPMHRHLPPASCLAFLALVLLAVPGFQSTGCAKAKLHDRGQLPDVGVEEAKDASPIPRKEAGAPGNKDVSASPDILPVICDPVANTGCDSGMKCSALQQDRSLVLGCAVKGSKGEGESCKQTQAAGVQTGDDCGIGLACFSISEGGSSTCHKFCSADGDTNACMGSELCSLSSPGLPANVKFCAVVSTCLPLEQTGCPTGKACYFSSTGAVCSQVGNKNPGDSCSNANDCISGSTCIAGHCASFCSMASGGTPSCAGTSTGGSTCSSFGSANAEANLGYCKN